ncbi:alpha/beta hydrolase [Nocardioides kribbensis]|uniref:alpha/beta hydrolase n=1 Tax=Nocardioides kribbensis TaxID=305517 RepID=UPI0032D9E663
MSNGSPLQALAHAAQKAALGAAMSLPPSVQRRLAGSPVVLDGQTLAVDTQLMLKLQKLSGDPPIETMAFPDGRVQARVQTAMAGGKQPIGAVRDLEVAGLPARLYTPRARVSVAVRQPPAPLLVFFHGGGFFFGDLDTHDATCRILAERGEALVLAVDYRLAPEHRFPAAYDDAVAAYRWAVEHVEELGVDRDRIAVGGDSAGGNLAAGVALEAARSGLPCAFQLLVYPATDATRATESLRLFGAGFYLSAEFMELANDSYMTEGLDPRDPRLSPAYADVPEGVAPAYVCTAGFDPLRDEGEAYARKLSDAGVTVELKRFEDQIHSFFNIVGVGRSSRAAVAEIADRLRAGLAPRA